MDQVIHIQIKEGELLPRGNINATTIAWKPIEAFSILAANVKSNVDYATLAWENKGVDLDDLVSDQDHLLTGMHYIKRYFSFHAIHGIYLFRSQV